MRASFRASWIARRSRGRTHDTDEFNRELIQKYATWSEADLFAHYEAVRIALIDLAADLPKDAFINKDIESWLNDDVVEHYDEHSIPGSR